MCWVFIAVCRLSLVAASRAYSFFYKFIYFLAALGPRFCARALSNCGKRGPLPAAARGPLTAAAPPAAEHRLQTRRPSSRGSRAQPPRGMRDPPGLGHEPASPALAGGLPTTAPPGKPKQGLLFIEVRRLLIAEASRCRAPVLGARASVVVAHGLSSCGSRVLEHRLSS